MAPGVFSVGLLLPSVGPAGSRLLGVQWARGVYTWELYLIARLTHLQQMYLLRPLCHLQPRSFFPATHTLHACFPHSPRPFPACESLSLLLPPPKMPSFLS